MAIKVYMSGICGSQEVRKRQQRVLFILQTMPIELEVIDVTEPGREDERVFMQEELKKHDKKVLLPPQIFNDTEYCGDYADFQLANDDDDVMRFLKLETGVKKTETAITQNGFSEKNKDEETKEVSEEVDGTTGEITNVPDKDVNADESQVEIQNTDTLPDDASLNTEGEKDTSVKPKEKAVSFEEESEEEESE